MAYATLSDATDLYGEDYVILSADRDDDLDADSDATTAAFDQATSQMESYLGTRYDLPLSTVPDILVRLCVDIAVYQLSAEAHALTEEKRVRYDDAIKWLKDVARGVATLGIDVSTNEGSEPEYSSGDRLFTRTTLRGLL